MTEKYKVTRQVLFDRLYQAGEAYEGNASEVAHLVANGVLVKTKAEPAPKNKAEPKVENKAAD
ncbi:hypothetical protein [Brevundimonas sp. P7753]|uniref:hypothetical protein n=1 Tax=Brevundimonas sp. P7753 TaxID=2726982 RepID=UPI0015C00414|nr:hypothetical protein [Brevundimonas sp. P7753]NWE53700.1 hypothetical protein [Brevundimonas sp. P7753]